MGYLTSTEQTLKAGEWSAPDPGRSPKVEEVVQENVWGDLQFVQGGPPCGPVAGSPRESRQGI